LYLYTHRGMYNKCNNNIKWSVCSWNCDTSWILYMKNDFYWEHRRIFLEHFFVSNESHRVIFYVLWLPSLDISVRISQRVYLSRLFSQLEKHVCFWNVLISGSCLFAVWQTQLLSETLFTKTQMWKKKIDCSDPFCKNFLTFIEWKNHSENHRCWNSHILRQRIQWNIQNIINYNKFD